MSMSRKTIIYMAGYDKHQYIHQLDLFYNGLLSRWASTEAPNAAYNFMYDVLCEVHYFEDGCVERLMLTSIMTVNKIVRGSIASDY